MKKNLKKITAVVVAGMMTALTACGSSGSVQTSATSSAETEKKESSNDSGGERIWPTTKNVEITCPASAGGLTDSAARIWANYLSEQFPDTNFIVNNDNTGNGTVAMEKIRNSKKTDGSEILFYNTGMMLAYYTGAYEHTLEDDFQLCTIGYTTTPDGFELCVTADSKYDDMKSLVDDIVASPDDFITGVQNGSTRQFLAGAMQASIGAKFKTVDTGSEADTLTALLGGNINFAFIQPGNAKQYVDNGDLKVLAICQDERSENYPDVPTTKEQGYDGMNVNSLQLICGPKGMSDDIANAIAETMQGYAESETVKSALENMKVTYSYTTREDCQKLVAENDKIYAEAAKTLGY